MDSKPRLLLCKPETGPAHLEDSLVEKDMASCSSRGAATFPTGEDTQGEASVVFALS